MAALAALAGILPEFGESRWPRDREQLEAIILEAREERHREFDVLSLKIAQRVGEMLNKSL